MTVAEQVRQQFRPEFINRIDEFIVFQALDKLQIAQIVRLQVTQRAKPLYTPRSADVSSFQFAVAGLWKANRACTECGAGKCICLRQWVHLGVHTRLEAARGAWQHMPCRRACFSPFIAAQIKRVADRLSGRKIRLEVTEDAIEFLASRGYDPAFGARPVKRVVQQLLETAIAKVRP